MNEKVALFAAQVEAHLENGVLLCNTRHYFRIKRVTIGFAITFLARNRRVSVRTGKQVELRELDVVEELDSLVLVPYVDDVALRVTVCKTRELERPF